MTQNSGSDGRIYRRTGLTALAAAVFLAGGVGADTGILNRINVGDEESEADHNLTYEHSEVITGAFDQPARRLLPKDDPEWRGGSMTFTVNVDPDRTNYVSFKCWGSEAENNSFYLFHDEQLIALSGLFDFIIGTGRPRRQPPFPNRFFYVTRKIPRHLTEGRESIRLTLQSAGPGWGKYGRNPGHQTRPGRGIYRIYSHNAPFFEPPEDEPQGEPFEWGPDQPAPDKYADRDVSELLIEKVDSHIEQKLEEPPSDVDRRALLKIYDKEWSKFHRSREVLEHAVKGVIEYVDTFVQEDRVDYHRWSGVGRSAGVELALAYEAIEATGALEEKIDHDNNPETEPIPRRKAYEDFFTEAFRLAWDKRRGGMGYTANLPRYRGEGIYWMNKVLEKLDSDAAKAQEEIMDYLYEVKGLGEPSLVDKKNVSAKGLPRERGFYNAGYSSAGSKFYDLTGDELIRRKEIQRSQARSYFWRPANMTDGYRVKRVESQIGVRTRPYPDRVEYVSPATAASLGNPTSIRSAQLYLKSNRIYEDQVEADWNLNYLWNTINWIDGFLEFLDIPETDYRLPMEEEHPDYVFSDEELGVIAMKHGDRQVHVGLVRRMHGAPDNHARIHYTTPTIDRVVVVGNPPLGMEKSDNYQTIQDHITVRDEEIPLAYGGKEFPAAPEPPAIYDRMAPFYNLRYGDYIFAMNTTETETYEFEAPVKFAEDLVSGRIYYRPEGSINIEVPPQTTVVLYLGKE